MLNRLRSIFRRRARHRESSQDPSTAQAVAELQNAIDKLTELQNMIAADSEKFRAGGERILKDLEALEHIVGGSGLLANGRDTEAVKEFDRALRLTPNNSRALVGKGLALAKLGNQDQARQALVDAEEHRQPSDQIADDLARAYAVLGDKTNALRFLAEAVAADQMTALIARGAEEFAVLREDTDFKRIVGEL